MDFDLKKSESLIDWMFSLCYCWIKFKDVLRRVQNCIKIKIRELDEFERNWWQYFGIHLIIINLTLNFYRCHKTLT